MKRIVTPAQTVGPYFHIGFGLVPPLSRPDVPGERIAIRGRVLDGRGDPVPDSMLETWQANSRGKYDHPEDWQDIQTTPGFSGFGRLIADRDGGFALETIRPGAVPANAGGLQAPHIVVSVFARGLLKHLVTRVYFQGDPLLGQDPVLRRVQDPARRDTLLARPDGARPGSYRWDIVLQGERETVFFDC